MLASRYPSELERDGFYFAGWAETVSFFPALLQSAGIRTLSAQSHFYFDKRSGFRRLFDAYAMVPDVGDDHQTDNNITSPEQLRLALEILSDKANVAGRSSPGSTSSTPTTSTYHTPASCGATPPATCMTARSPLPISTSASSSTSLPPRSGVPHRGDPHGIMGRPSASTAASVMGSSCGMCSRTFH